MNGDMRIVCVGSPFGGDRLGWWAFEQLQSRMPGSDVRYLDRPGAGLIGVIRGARKLILVDAVITGGAAGSVHRIEGDAIYRQLARHTSTHGFGLAEALQLAARLGDLPSRVVLHGMELGTEASQLEPLLAAVVREVEEGTPCATG